jgi:hypothetical protein
VPCCLLSPVLLYRIYPHYLINGTIFGKKTFEHEMCVLIFSTISSEKFLVVRLIERYIIMHVLCIGLHVNYPLFL